MNENILWLYLLHKTGTDRFHLIDDFTVMIQSAVLFALKKLFTGNEFLPAHFYTPNYDI